MLLAALLAGHRADGVLGEQAAALLADREVPLQQVFVILHLGDLVDFLEDGLLGDLQDLDFAGLVVVDRAGDGKLHVGGARAAAAFAGLELAHLSGYVLDGGLVVEAEGLGGAVGLAPALVELQGFVGQQREADGAAVGEFAEAEVAAAGAVGRNSSRGLLGKERHWCFRCFGGRPRATCNTVTRD